MDYAASQRREASEYLEKHKINEIFQLLSQAVLMDSPETPREYLINHLQLMRKAKVKDLANGKARNQNHAFFTRENLQSLFKFYDQVGRGFITLAQYHEAMSTIGASNYSQKPPGQGNLGSQSSGLDRINAETFVQEASTAIRML